MKKESLMGKTFSAMLAMAFSKCLAFVRTAVIAANFGVTAQTDAFNMAVGILTTLSGPSTGMTVVVVPLRTELLASEGRGHADRFSGALLNLVLLITAFMAVLLCLAAPWLVRIFAPNFSGDIFNLTVTFTRIFLPLLTIIGAANFLTGILNTHKRYLIANCILIPFNLAYMAFPLLLADRLGVQAMVIGYLVGTVLQLAVLIPGAKGVFRYRFHLNWHSPWIRRALVMCIPVFIGSLSQSINLAVGKALAGGLAVGSISALAYATQLVTMVMGVIVTPIATTAFTELSSCAQAGDMQTLKRLLMDSFSIFSLILLPITAYSVIYYREIISVVFERGAFGAEAGVMTGQAFLFYSLSFLPTALTLACTRCFHALLDTKTPLWINLGGIAVNTSLSFLLVRLIGLGGLTLAISTASVFTSIVSLAVLRKRLGRMGLSSWLREISKCAAAFMALVACILLLRGFALPALQRLMIAGVAGIGLYSALLIILRDRYTLRALDALRALFRRK